MEYLDPTDYARATAGPQVDDYDWAESQRVKRLIDAALSAEFAAIALDDLVINGEVSFEQADAAYRKEFGFGLDSGLINDRQEKREIEERAHPFRAALIGVVR